MLEKKIRKIAQIMKETGLTMVELTQNDGTVIHLERLGVMPGAVPDTSLSSGEKETVFEPVATRREQAAAEYVEIKSPMVGIFYAAPSPEAEPYVKVGDYVQSGDVVCLIEAMKLFNEITADWAGRVAEICVADGQAVEYGQTLIKLLKE